MRVRVQKMQSDLHIVVEGDLLVFRAEQNDGHKGGRVLCPTCSSVVDRGKARRHYTRNHVKEIMDDACQDNSNEAQQSEIDIQRGATTSSSFLQQSEGTGNTEEEESEKIDNTAEEESEINLQNSATTFRKRKRNDEDDHAVWNRLCGEVPASILTSTMASMPANAYTISGHGLILPPATLTFLQGILPHGYTLSKIDLSKAINQLMTNDDTLSTLDGMSPIHLRAVEWVEPLVTQQR
ncbi:hypothetical protein BGZ94_001607 [Podila epigama]|nr:hypothetical protein BGZ94_001607 [Podila epigama]